MPQIKFDYNGQTFEANVTDEFLSRPEENQQTILESQLLGKYDEKIRSTGDKGFLDYLAMLERPAQALKVGFKESEAGADLFKALGHVDLTPKEGFFTGLGRGWMGEEEVRTQDFLPEDMNPILKGVLGFAGDVATDPLTYFGGSLAVGIGKGVRAATPRPVAQKLQDFKEYAVQKDIKGYGLPDIGRWFNVPVGTSAKKSKGILDQSMKEFRRRDKETAEGVANLSKFFREHAGATGVGVAQLKRTFRNLMEDPDSVTVGQQNALGDEGMALVDEWKARIDHWRQEEQAMGLTYEALEDYFPHIATPAGKAYLAGKADDVIEGIDEYGQPIYKASYRMARTEKGDLPDTVDAFNKSRAMALGSKTRNPTELPFEHQFFYEDPTVALGTRWAKHNKSIQLKWAKDELSDSPTIFGQQFSSDMFDWRKKGYRSEWDEVDEKWNYIKDKVNGSPEDGWARRNFRSYRDPVTDEYMNGYEQWQQFLKDQPLRHETGIGRWIKRDPNDPDGFLVRTVNPARLDDPLNKDVEKYLWEPFEESIGDYTKLKGIPGHSIPDEMLDAEWVRVWTEQLRLRGLGRFSKQRLSDAEMKKLPTGYREARDLADAAKEKMMLDTNEVFIAPKQIARQVEDHLSIMGGDVRGTEQIDKFLSFYDQTQNAWKAWTLGVRPAYHTRNAIGNILNAYTVTGLGENIPKAVETFKNAAQLQYYARWSGSTAARDEVVTALRGTMRGELEDMPYPNMDEALWTQEYADTGFTMEQIVEAAVDRGINAGHYRSDIVREYTESLASGEGIGSRLKRLLGPDNPFVRGGFIFGGTIEGNARYAVFLDTLQKIRQNPSKFEWAAPDGKKIRLDKFHNEEYFTTEVRPRVARNVGDEPEMEQVRRLMTKDEAIMDVAGQQVKSALFDYSDVSRFERGVFKRVMPFYTWTRNNIPTQLKHLVLNPQRAEKLAIAKEQFEHETGDLDNSDYGAMWGDRVPIFLGKENHGVVKAFMALNVVPMADLQRILKPGPLLTEMVSPLIKAPLEQISNYDTFRKKKIVKLGGALSLGEPKDFLGVALPSRLWHLTQLLVPLVEINRVNPAGVFGERMVDPTTGKRTVTEAYAGLGARRESNPIDAPEVARWIRFFSGAAVYDVDLRQQRYFMNKNLKRDLAELVGKLKYARANQRTRLAERLIEVIDMVQQQELTDPFDRR